MKQFLYFSGRIAAEWHKILIALLLNTILTGGLMAKARPAPATGPMLGLLQPEKVLAVARKISRKIYPNADDVLVDDFIRTRYETDGRAETWDDTFIKVLTEKGRRDNQELTLYFTFPYSQSEFLLVEVYKPDGSRVPVDVAQQSKIMIDRSQMGANIYNPNQKILRLGIPKLEIGDVVHYVSHRKLVKPRVPNTWSDYMVFEYTSPIKHMTYEVLAPPTLPLRNIALKSPVKNTITASRGKRDGRLVYRWDVKDVPRMYREPDMPSLSTVVQRLLVSTIPDWQTISKWYWKLASPHFQVTPEMKQQIQELIAGKKNDEDKVRALFTFVSQQIRYMGITVEKNAPGYEPHDVALTFEKRHGVCRDKAALLVAMLRDAGFQAFPTLIHNGPKKDVEVPQPYFNHAIVAWLKPDGSYQLMDPTDENTRRLFPAYLCNQSYLVARPEGETLLTSPIIPAKENLMQIKTIARLDAQGTLSGETTLRFLGINDNAYRGYFAHIKPEERRRFFEGAVKRLAAGARLTDFSLQPVDMMNTSQPLQARLRFTARNVPIQCDQTLMLPLPLLGSRIGMVNFILGKTGLPKRKYPMQTHYACGVKESISLQLAPAIGKPLALPSYPDLKGNVLSWNARIAMDKRTLTFNSAFLLHQVELTPKQYLELKDALKTIEIQQRKRALFQVPKRQQGNNDIEILDDDTQYKIESPTAWTVIRKVKKRILSYKGKKENAELKINFNPARESVKILSATVTNGKKVEKISEQEINLMDAGWVAGAPRYPAGKTLVASLPSVEIGSVIEYTLERRVRAREFFSLIRSFRGANPIRHCRVRIDAPTSLRLTTSLLPHGLLTPNDTHDAPVTKHKTSKNDRVLLTWETHNQPALEPEDQMPPWWSMTPSLFVSSLSWAEYTVRLQPLLTAAAARQPNTERAAHKIIAGRKDPRKRLIAIRDAVDRRIRKAGPGLPGLPLSAITPADRTLADGYGNTTDRAVLLYALLRASGFKPEWVLASYLPRQRQLLRQRLLFPAASAFSSVLVRVRTPKAIYYLNDTGQYDALGAMAHDGFAGLEVASGAIITLKAQPDQADRTEHDYQIKLDDNGNAVLTQTFRYSGSAYTYWHRRFAEMPPEERRRYHLEAVAAIARGAEADGALQTDFSSSPGVKSFRVRIPQFAICEGDFLYFTLPESLNSLFRLRADQRRQPLYLNERKDFTLRYKIEVPPAWTTPLITPPPLHITLPDQGGEISISSKFTPADNKDPAQLTVLFRVNLFPAAIAAADYGILTELKRKLSHARARTILFHSTH